MMEILIYAAIALFLFYRLWSVLGQTGEDGDSAPPRRNPFAPQDKTAAEEDDVLVIEGRARPMMPSALTQQGHAPTSLAGALDQIKHSDTSFDEKKFIEGAKAAFTHIVTAFAAQNLAPVERWLGPEVKRPFEAAIANWREKGQTLENKIDRIVAADIIAASLVGSVASLTVEFVSYQVNVLRDKDGAILDGSPAQAEEVRDTWVFERNTSATDPNWHLVETRS